MTVNVVSQPTQYPGNGSATVFSFPYLLTAASDLVVGFITGTAPNTVYALQSSVTYSIPPASINNSGGGQITFNTAPPAGTTVDLRTLLPETQPTNFSNLGPYLPESNTAAVDRCVRLIQDLNRLTYLFGIHGPDTESTPWPTLPVPSARANQGLGFDSNGLPTLISSVGNFTQSTFNGYLSNAAPFVITAAEIAAGVTVTDTTKLPGNFLRYGSGGDITAALQAAVAQAAQSGGAAVFGPPGSYTVSGAVGGYSNVLIQLHPGCLITSTTGAASQTSIFSFTQQSNVHIYGGQLSYQNPGSTYYIAGVAFINCTNCSVEETSFTAMPYHGVWLLSSSYCLVRGCSFSAFLGTLSDQADVAIMSSSAGSASNQSPLGGDCVGNVVEDNFMFGGGYHGVLCQDPYTVKPYLCRKNIIRGNRITQHTGYGVAVYQPAQAATFNGTISTTTLTVTGSLLGTIAAGQRLVDGTSGAFYANIVSGAGSTWTLDTSQTIGSPTKLITSQPSDSANDVSANVIENIQGSNANTSSGAGIYVVGVGCGGTRVRGNSVYNCCVQTSASSLGAAGIVFSGIYDGILLALANPVCEGNIVSGMTQGHGINITGCPAGVVVGPNSVTIPSTNNGRGAGSSALIGSALNIVNSDSTSVSGGSYQSSGSGNALLIYANGVNQGDITVSGGFYESIADATVQIAQNGGFSNQQTILDGVRAKNYGTASTCYALQWSNGTNGRVTGGVYTTAGSGYGVVINGTNTGSLIDQANWGSNGFMDNGGGGMNVRFRGSATPQGGAGTFAVADVCDNTAPTATGSLLWVCTTAGSAGTWTASTLP